MGKSSNAVPLAAASLDADAVTPLYRQLYESLRTAILEGRLAPGTRLPATRELAAELSVSRNTVMSAFEQLLAEGYVEGRVGAGTFVSESLPDDLLNARANLRRAPRSSVKGRRLSKRGELLAATSITVNAPARGVVRPFRTGVPALDAFPFDVWSRLVARHWRRPRRDLLTYGDPAGFRPLREAIAHYLGAARAVRCSPEQVIVVAGTQQAVDLSARVLLDANDSVWVEEYGYLAARGSLAASGARLVPVPVDAEGINVAAGSRLCADARMAYVSPSHQYPLGVTLSLSRRLELLEWASRAGAWILEDDYDSEFRYEGRPLAAMQGLDTEGRVIYLGTFSKVLFASLRMGYMVVPADLVEAFSNARALVGWCSPVVEQAIVCDFINEGHFARHIRRMRALYAERRATLISTLRREFGDTIEIAHSAAGMHLLAWLPEGVDDRAIAREADARGVQAQPLSAFALKGADVRRRGGLVLGYAAYNEREARDAVAKLSDALRAATRPTRRTSSRTVGAEQTLRRSARE
jgi:GntR family transcriptional regulator/MocR family aminotransferase